MKETYKTKVGLVIELVIDDTHETGKRMKYVATRDPDATSHIIAEAIDNILQHENEKAVFAKMNVVAVSQLMGDLNI